MDNQQPREAAEVAIFNQLYQKILANDLNGLNQELQDLDQDRVESVLSHMDQQGNLLLGLAVLSGKLEACQILVGHGANLRESDDNGNRAIDLLYIPELEINNADQLRAWFEEKHRELGIPLREDVFVDARINPHHIVQPLVGEKRRLDEPNSPNKKPREH